MELLQLRGFEVHAVARRPPETGGDGAIWHAADLLDASERDALVEAARASHLLHLAWFAEPGAFWTARENAAWVAASVGLLDAFAAAGGARAVLAGTCAEYDWADIGGPLREDAPTAPATFYGVCKDATRRVAEALGERTGVEIAWGRIFFLYGPDEDERRLVSSVARSLVVGERAATSAGTQVRDFLHVEDVAAAFAAIVDGGARGAVNVGSGEGVTVRRILDLIAQATGRPDLLDVGALPARPDDPHEIVADVGRLRDEVGFVPAIDLQQGIAATVARWRERTAR